MSVVTNQYTDLIPVEWFTEYKKPETTAERKKELEEEFFKIVRGVNELPRNDFKLDNQIASLKVLASCDKFDIYKYDRIENGIYVNAEYGLNAAGVDFLYEYFPNLNDVEKVGCKSIRDSFYDDHKLHRVVRKTLTYSYSVLDIYRWLRLCGAGYCTNFRPASAKALYEIFAPKDAKIYDFAMGYGARMLGAHFAENVREYVSVDVNTETVEGAKREVEFLEKYYNTGTKLIPYLCGSEEFLQLHPEYKGYFDLSFSSPQYFNTEIYSKEQTQSCHKYPNYVNWVKYFYRPTIHNAIDVLKDGGTFAINIFEKLKNLKGDQNLREITKFIAAEKGFYLFQNDKYLMRTMPGLGTVDKETGEKVARDRSIGSNFEAVWVFAHYKTLRERNLINDEFYNKCKERDVNKKE